MELIQLLILAGLGYAVYKFVDSRNQKPKRSYKQIVNFSKK